jgi:crotonobetainyl-CoA:carnitine CoA-transferase CaiB-like acyl-CoA transferase
MNFNSADLKKKLDLLQIPNGIIHKMTDIIDNQEYINSNYIKKVDHPQLGNITVPFEFIKYDQFPLENYIISPEKNTY